ncbi:MAG TPA: glycosyltransferase [Bdellovibrionota bacterium]|nr:glycosyltransferase [Bdellovibrionota bacterium]
MTQSIRSHWPISILSSVASLVNMALPLVLVRLLSQDQIGQFKIFFLYIGILPAFSLAPGIVSGLAYWAGQSGKRDRALQISAYSILGSALLSAALAFGLGGVVSARFGWPMQYSHLFALALFGAVGNMFFEEAAIATGRIWTGALFLSGFDALRTSSMLVTAAITRDLGAVLIAHTSMILIKTMIGYAVAYRLGLVKAVWDSEAFRSVWKYALPVATAWIFGIFINNADQFVLSTHIAAADFAVYTLGCLSIPPLLIIEQSVTRVMIPQMAAAFSEADGAPRAAALYRKGIEQLAFLVLPAVAGLVVFADGIVSLLFTAKYASAAVYLRVYAISYLMLVLPYDSVPRARGQGGWIFNNFLFFSIFSLGLCFAGVRLWGPMGALAGALFSRGVMKIYAMIYVHRSTGWKFNQFLPFGPFARFGAISLALSAISVAIHPLFSSDVRWFLAVGPVFALAYFAAVLRFGAATGERKVLMVTQYLGMGGLEKMILNLCLEYQATGQWEPRVFAYEQREAGGGYMSLLPEFRKAGIPVDTFLKGRGFSIKAVLRLIKIVLREDVRVLHSHDLNGLIYAAAAKALLLGRVRLVHTQHSFVHLARAKRYRTYEKFFTFFVDELTVVSEDTKRRYGELGLPPSRVRLVQNGVSFPQKPIASRAEKIEARKGLIESVQDAAVRARLKELQGASWILYLARIHPVKGQAHALKIWAAMDPQVRRRSALILVGPATHPDLLDELMTQASGLPDADRVVFTGGTHEPYRWFSSSDVYLSCSDFEGMPLGPIEAMGSGLPAVLSDIEGHAFLGKHSTLISVADPETSAELLSQVVYGAERADGSEYRRHWDRSQWIRDGYSMGRMAKSYIGLYGRGLTREMTA